MPIHRHLSGPCAVNAVLDVTLDAGNYYLIVDGWGNESGAFYMSVTCPGDPPPPPIPPAPLDRNNAQLACINHGTDEGSCFRIGCCHWYGGTTGCQSVVGTGYCHEPLCNSTEAHFVCQDQLCNATHPPIDSWEDCRDAALAIGLVDTNPSVVTLQAGSSCTTDYNSVPGVYCVTEPGATPGGCYYKPTNADYAQLWYNPYVGAQIRL